MRNPPISRWLELMFQPNYEALPYENPQFRRFLYRNLTSNPNPQIRFICAHHSRYASQSRLCNAIMHRAADSTEHPVVRGQCLEQFSFRRNTETDRRFYRRARRLVLKCLADPDANVRYWACYAAAQLKLRRAVSLLQKLKFDQGVGDMGQTVGYEAREALKALDGRNAWDESSWQQGQPHGYPDFWSKSPSE